MSDKISTKGYAYNRERTFKTRILTAAISAAMLSSAGMTLAQEIEEISVTGSRIVRDGYSAPTPVTVVGKEEIQKEASPKLIDYLSTLPAFAGNLTPASATGNISAGRTGTSGLNLRNLGTNRTLVLIDGRRAVASTVTGVVDINGIPSQLVDRVEVVTGGASAAYGSDAVSGVVNFILDKDFTGFEVEASGGMTNYNDGQNYSASMTFGTAFAGGRGHFIASGQASSEEGLLDADRDWIREGRQALYNPGYTPTNGQPEIKGYTNVSPYNAAPGGIIVSGPLKGVAFGPGGTPFQLNYGPVIADISMAGGDYDFTSVRETTALSPDVDIKNLFGRVSYDLTDNMNVYAQAQWSENESLGYAYPHDIYYGGLKIPVSNPFVPASIAAQAQKLGLNTLELGTWFKDLGSISNNNTRESMSIVVGLDSGFTAFGTDWVWDAYLQFGASDQFTYARNSARFDRLPLALDTVVSPQTGVNVCRSTLTNPGNGCVPFNPFGVGVNSFEAVDYLVGTASHREENFEQTVVATSIQGDIFENWAGSVSLATGFEYREESVKGSSTALDKKRVFWGGNYLPTNGDYHISEAFAETIVPLAVNQSWAESLDLNAAVRVTDYSTSGTVTTWKVGLTYAPISDLRLRMTESRDIRAPNLSDLYNGGTVGLNLVTDPSTKSAVTWAGGTEGNPNLHPEESDAFGFGLVYQPSFLAGFATSIDYWTIDIEEAINTYSAQRIVDLCYQGTTSFCSAINNGQPLHPTSGNNPNTIKVQPFNLASESARGVDVEVSYNTPMSLFNDNWNGDLTMRVLGSKYLENERDDGGNITDTVGQNRGDGPPDMSWKASLTYDLNAFSATLGARGVSDGVLDNTYVECASGCPVSTRINRTIDNNAVKGATYFDLSLSYVMPTFLSSSAEVEMFMNVKNLADKDPATVTGGPGGYVMNLAPTNISLYDTMGRVFMLGARVRL